jgi:hypothetical protein
VCYLTKWNTLEALENGAFSGVIFETYAVSEILKSYWHNGVSPAVYFYGDKAENKPNHRRYKKFRCSFPVQERSRPGRSVMPCADSYAIGKKRSCHTDLVYLNESKFEGNV